MTPDNITAAARHHWWLFLLRGTAALAFGVLTLWWPGATLVVLMAFIAAYALVDGLVALVYAFQLRPLFDRWWVLLLQGLISGAFGVLACLRAALALWWLVVAVALWVLLSAVVPPLPAWVLRARRARSRSRLPGASRCLAPAVTADTQPRPRRSPGRC